MNKKQKLQNEINELVEKRNKFGMESTDGTCNFDVAINDYNKQITIKQKELDQVTGLTFEQWTKTLDADQIDFILEDYFSSHPDVENGLLIKR